VQPEYLFLWIQNNNMDQQFPSEDENKISIKMFLHYNVFDVLDDKNL